MEVDRQLLVGAHLPERVPGPAGQVGAADVVGVRGDVDAAHVHRCDALSPRPRRPRRPRPGAPAWAEATARRGLHVGHGVVVDLHARQAELGVLHHVGDALAAEADGARKAHLGVDARVVHDVDARLGVEGAEVDAGPGSTRRAPRAARPLPPSRSMTPPPPAKPSSAPSTIHIGLASTSTTWGTRSLYLAGARSSRGRGPRSGGCPRRSPATRRVLEPSCLPELDIHQLLVLDFDVDVEYTLRPGLRPCRRGGWRGAARDV